MEIMVEILQGDLRARGATTQLPSWRIEGTTLKWTFTVTGQARPVLMSLLANH